MTNKIIAIVGPTASGKSALAVRLGQKFNGEVISVDSRQVYRGLDIGSGKFPIRDRKKIKHHLLDVTDPKKTFSVVQYKKLAEKAVREVIRRGKLPILCGGAGFYLDAVLNVVTMPPAPPNRALRAQLEKLSAKILFAQLKILDPIRAENIDSKNRQRLIRAIEIATFSQCQGSTLAEKGRTLNQLICPWQCLKIGILVDKEKLRQKIARRLDLELKSGLLTEVKKLHQHGLSWQRLDDFGLEYRFVSRYLRNQLTKTEMVKQLQTAIWRYAKRQMTWFKRDKNIVWIKTRAEGERRVRDFLKKSNKVE